MCETQRGGVRQITKITRVYNNMAEGNMVEMAKFAEQAERYEDMAKVSLKLVVYSSSNYTGLSKSTPILSEPCRL